MRGDRYFSLGTLKVRYWDHSDSDNPPILHHKEQFVADDHPSRDKFERLSHQEKRWGLYENPYAIGTKEQWEEVLAEKGVTLRGHRLIRTT